MSDHVTFEHGDYVVDIVHLDDSQPDGQTIVAYTKFREIHEPVEGDETPPA